MFDVRFFPHRVRLRLLRGPPREARAFYGAFRIAVCRVTSDA